MKLLSHLLLLVFVLHISMDAAAQSGGQPGDAAGHPFAKHHRVAAHVWVADPSQFRPDTSTKTREGDQGRAVGRYRIGKVSLTPSLQVLVERVTALHHGASFVELFDVKSEKMVGSFDLGLVGPDTLSSDLLFTGQGIVYWHQRPPYLCAGTATRKFVLRGSSLKEVPQPFLSIDFVAETNGPIKLFSSVTPSAQVVAELPSESSVQVIGVVSDSEYPSLKGQYPGDPAMLVRTPVGLVGWHLGSRSGGLLSITACN